MKPFTLEEYKKNSNQILVLEHYDPQTPEYWIVGEAEIVMGGQLAIKVPETGFDTKSHMMFGEHMDEVRDWDDNLVGFIRLAEPGEHIKISIAELSRMVANMQVGQTIDFDCDEDSDHWGVQKLRLFDGEVIAIGSYGGGITTMLDRQFYQGHDELLSFIKDSLSDHTPDFVYVEAPERCNQPHYNDGVTKCVAKLKGCINYNDADKILKEHGLSLAIYGNYESPVAYATYTLSGDKDEPRHITLYYEFKKVGHDSYVADKVINIEVKE